MHLNLIKVM
jgi:hypothetical protein